MKAFIILAEGFEEVEAVGVVDVLRRANIDLLTVSESEDPHVLSSKRLMVRADKVFSEVDFLEGQLLILPGGPGTKRLKKNQALKNVIASYVEQKKWIAAICAAPSILGEMNLLKGVRATCYPGFESTLKDAMIVEESVVVDRNFITSKGPGTALVFALRIVSLCVGEEESRKLQNAMLIPEQF